MTVMMKYAVVDLEATGASHTSKIIQIGIVIVENGRIINTYQTDVNPHEKLDNHIIALTGITTAQVAAAPDFDCIMSEVAEILRGCTFVAHNVKFDYNLLMRTFAQYGVNLSLPRVDTIELARIFFPTLNKYGLGSLSRVLNLSHERPHEALSDAYATAELLIKLQEKMHHLPKHVLTEIVRHADSLIYETKLVISEQLTVSRPLDDNFVNVKQIATKKTYLSNNKNLVSKNLKTNLALLNLDDRPKQWAFAKLVNKHLADPRASFIEAPTGIGKTYAYLLSLLGQNKKVIVSVPTKVLQEQLVLDLAPVFKANFGVNFVKVLGTQNYISLEKFSHLLESCHDGKNYEIFKMKVLVWLTETQTGELDELSLIMTSPNYLDAIRHSGKVYKGQLHFEQDFWRLTQQRIKDAQVIVMNHAYLAERILDQTELFEDKVLVIDEAQQLFSVLEHAHQKSVNLVDELVKVDTRTSQLQKRLLESLTYQLSRRQLDVEKISLDAKELGLSEISDVVANPDDFVWVKNHVLKSSPKDFLNFAAMIPIPTKTYLIGATLAMSEHRAVFPELLGFTDYTFDIVPTAKRNNQKIFVASDSPDLTNISAQAYAEYLSNQIQVFKRLGKPIVVLFTSNESLSLTAQALSAADVPFLTADTPGDASRVKRKFDEQNDAILLGSKKFWEGVDFDKQDELILIITRLPFSVPDDILIRKYAKRFKNAFYEFSVPLATLQLEQAFGRVNRREKQKSAVVILDKRLAGKTYAKQMVKKLSHGNQLFFATIDQISSQIQTFFESEE